MPRTRFRLRGRAQSVGSRLGWAALALWNLAACTRFASDQDVADAFPSVPQATLASSWSCVGAAAPPTAALGLAVEATRVDYHLRAVNVVSDAPVPEILVRACYRDDISCMEPVTERRTSADATVTLPLAIGFDGFLELTGEGVAPTLFSFPDALSRELVSVLELQPITILPASALSGLGAGAPSPGTFVLPLEADRGIVAISTYDCTGAISAGVRLELNSAAIPFSIVDGAPAVVEDTTTDDGVAGFANVLPGFSVVRGYRTDTGALVGLDTVMVRAGWLTQGTLMPQFVAQP